MPGNQNTLKKPEKFVHAVAYIFALCDTEVDKPGIPEKINCLKKLRECFDSHNVIAGKERDVLALIVQLKQFRQITGSFVHLDEAERLMRVDLEPSSTTGLRRGSTSYGTNGEEQEGTEVPDHKSCSMM